MEEEKDEGGALIKDTKQKRKREDESSSKSKSRKSSSNTEDEGANKVKDVEDLED